MKVGIVVPYSWSFWGGVQEHADHQARALRRLGHRRPDHHGARPARAAHLAPAPEAGTARAPARIRHPRRPVGDRAGERVASEHHPQPAVDAAHAADLGGGAVRRRPRARALRADPLRLRPRDAPCPIVATCHSAGDRLGWYPVGEGAVGRSSRAGSTSGSPSRRRPAAPRSRNRRSVRGDPQRDRPAADRRSGRPQRQRRLHRPKRAAQGPAGPAARLAGDPRAHGRPPAPRRRGSALRPLARAPPGLLARGDRPPRGGWTRTSSPPSSRRPACWSRPRSAARASGWC